MTPLDALAASISLRVKDYRAGEIPPFTPDHVLRWVQQFDNDVRVVLLSELDHVLAHTYYSQERTKNEFRNIMCDSSLTRGAVCSFWSRVNFLTVQAKGQSQRELLSIVDEILLEQCGFTSCECGGGNVFAYFDDGIFTGSHVRSDLTNWISNVAPNSARLIIITLLNHSSDEYYASQRLNEVARQSQKQITIEFYCGRKFENRRSYRTSSAVLSPVAIDEEAASFLDFVEESSSYVPRTPGGVASPSIYSSEAQRQVLENQLLKAGLSIRSRYGGLESYFRPLGFGNFGLGFGTMVVTYRNCPNNCPLALWWGNIEWPPTYWYPLFLRRTNEPSLKTSADDDDIPL